MARYECSFRRWFLALEFHHRLLEGVRPQTCLEAANNADTYVVVVLTASPGINVQVGSPGVEIARFDPPTPVTPRPHIQSSSELDYAGIGAARPRVRSAPNQIRGFPESPVAAARANPRGDSLAGKMFMRRDGVMNSAEMFWGILFS